MKKRYKFGIASFVIILALAVIIVLNPIVICACLPEYEGEIANAYWIARDTVSKSLEQGNLQFDGDTLRFTGESLALFYEKALENGVNPNYVWVRIKENTLINVLLRTERYVSYLFFGVRRQTIYIESSQGWRYASSSRPRGW